MVIVFTGNGKGKTTAALGQMVRASGRGRRSLMIQFIKGPWKSGEDYFTKMHGIDDAVFRIEKMGKGFVGILGDALPREEHEQAAQNALEYFRLQLSEGWDLIVLDEINNAIHLSLLEEAAVLEALKAVPLRTLVVLTGRDAPDAIIERADLATEMREIKHPYNDGKIAELGIEF